MLVQEAKMLSKKDFSNSKILKDEVIIDVFIKIIEQNKRLLPSTRYIDLGRMQHSEAKTKNP
jgi:predicted HTH domain antitoxin